MIKKMVYCAVYVAIVWLMSLVPFLGFINFGVVAITVLPITVAIATIHLGLIGALASSISMGIGSLVASYIYGDPLLAFYYPDISILPRVLMGVGVWLIAWALGKMVWYKVIIVGVSAAFLNTLFVSFFIFFHTTYLHTLEIVDGIGLKGWITLIWVNALVEMIVTGTIATVAWPLVFHLRKSHNPEKDRFVRW